MTSALFGTTAATLRRRTALVTGGTAGIGLETARGLARRGMDVVIAARGADRGREVAQDLVSDDFSYGTITFQQLVWVVRSHPRIGR